MDRSDSQREVEALLKESEIHRAELRKLSKRIEELLVAMEEAQRLKSRTFERRKRK